ncbi:hypothetical protein DFH28DRAFT_929407 [Melampsora americana]|nr:hypothetical protein DFH28DRAFT_929407 [Melampsora americana]
MQTTKTLVLLIKAVGLFHSLHCVSCVAPDTISATGEQPTQRSDSLSSMQILGQIEKEANLKEQYKAGIQLNHNCTTQEEELQKITPNKFVVAHRWRPSRAHSLNLLVAPEKHSISISEKMKIQAPAHHEGLLSQNGCKGTFMTSKLLCMLVGIWHAEGANQRPQDGLLQARENGPSTIQLTLLFFGNTNDPEHVAMSEIAQCLRMASILAPDMSVLHQLWHQFNLTPPVRHNGPQKGASIAKTVERFHLESRMATAGTTSQSHPTSEIELAKSLGQKPDLFQTSNGMWGPPLWLPSQIGELIEELSGTQGFGQMVNIMDKDHELYFFMYGIHILSQQGGISDTSNRQNFFSADVNDKWK